MQADEQYLRRTRLQYLKRTRLLDYDHPSIAALVQRKQWVSLTEEQRIRQIYNCVKNEIKFGYNVPNIIPASEILAVGRGECNSKGLLLMALLRACDIPCRYHVFSIDKSLQKGAMPKLVHRLLAAKILHSWVEVRFRGKWINLEGVILDHEYLSAVQERFHDVTGPFCGYALATEDLQNPCVEWTGGDTYIQRTAIIGNLGVYDSPDDFYHDHPTNVGGLKASIFRLFFLRAVNANVQRIRAQAESPVAHVLEFTQKVR